VQCKLVKGGLLGGKGGFGAALKASARSSTKVTTDFGACRDLNGRRLRHVNNEIRLRVWREEAAARKRAAEHGETWDPTKSKLVNTESGIDNWFLSVPGWSDYVPQHKGKRPKEYVSKLQLCQNWERVHSGKQRIPLGAPSWYGCPRGQRCRFAHGYAELAPEGKKRIAEEQKMAVKRKEVDAIHSFVEQANSIGSSLKDSIKCGLGRSKLDAVNGTEKALLLEESNAQSMESTSQDEYYVQCLEGDIGVGTSGEVHGSSAFATAAIPSVAMSEGVWYFEVEFSEDASTKGIAQVGWATESFEPSQSTNDGAGDTSGSWAIDPFRMIVFDQGKEEKFENSGALCPPGQKVTVGCTIDLDNKELVFSINGKQVAKAKLELQGKYMFYFPVVSLERDQFCRINLGEHRFVFVPENQLAQGLCGEGQLARRRQEEKTSSCNETMDKSKEPALETNPVVSLLDINVYDSVSALLDALTPTELKEQLSLRGLKCGGTPQQRGERLFSIRGLQPEQYSPSLKPPPRKKPKT